MKPEDFRQREQAAMQIIHTKNITVGLRFMIRFDHPWSGPCPHCGRRKALKRKYRGQLPCTTHQPASGWERSWYWATLTEVDASGLFKYETTERISITDPLPGTDGCKVSSGGMTAFGLIEGIRCGRIILDGQPAEGRVH